MNRLRSEMRLQPRDVALLRELHASRVMSLRHATTIVFMGVYQVAAKRIQKLKASRHIAEMPRRIGDPSILFLTARGRRQVATSSDDETSRGVRRQLQPKPLTLSHELEIIDSKAAILSALRTQTAWSVCEFTTCPTRSQFRVDHLNGTRTTVKPDGFLSLVNAVGQPADFFLEVDRSQETQAILEAKCRAYRSYYLSGDFAARCGRPRYAYRRHPFRVLIIVPSEERRNNLAGRLCVLERPIRNQVWLTTRADLLADALGMIWVCPEDYGRATFGTPFSPDTSNTSHQYRTIAERERIVRERITKRRLLNL